MALLPPDDSNALSHRLMRHFDEIMADTEHRAEKFDEAIQELSGLLAQGNWALAELLYWFDEHKLYREIGFANFVDYVRGSQSIPFGPAWAYILRGIYETYRIELGIGPSKPEQLEAVIAVGSFEKLHILRKILTPKNAVHWLQKAATSSIDDLRYAVRQELLALNAPPGEVEPPRVQMLRRRYKSPRLHAGDLAHHTLDELIPDLNIPENYVVEVTVRIVEMDKEEPEDGA